MLNQKSTTERRAFLNLYFFKIIKTKYLVIDNYTDKYLLRLIGSDLQIHENQRVSDYDMQFDGISGG